MQIANRLLATATAFGGLFAAGTVFAADFGAPMPPPQAVYPAPVYVAVNPYCMRWTARCDRRWGIGSPRFARCMWRHGC